jgi:hypothetical protein
MLLPLTEEERDKLHQSIRNTWKNFPIKSLELALIDSIKIKQKLEVRIQVLQELLDERRPDNKAKQYID